MLQTIIKRGFLLVGIIALTGCEATYTITIDKDTINEKIEVLDNVSDTRTVTDVMDGYKKKYPVYDIEDIIVNFFSTSAIMNYEQFKQCVIQNNSDLFFLFYYFLFKFKGIP